LIIIAERSVREGCKFMNLNTRWIILVEVVTKLYFLNIAQSDNLESPLDLH